MIVKNDLYNYNLYIYQNDEYFKFSIDSILLAEFVQTKNGEKILDMCTGNVPIPLILTTKYHNLTIDAVELQDEVYDLAQKSININKKKDIINIFHQNIKEFSSNYKYDVITCNPPYFKVNATSKLSTNKIKCVARHEISITLEEIMDKVKELLKENGRVYLVHRVERFIDVTDNFKRKKIGIKRVVFINTKYDKKAEFFLIEGYNNQKNNIKVYNKNIENIKDYRGIFEEELS